MRKRAVDEASRPGQPVPDGPMAIASEEPEHDKRVERKTREQMMEELALEYFRNRPRYQIWKVAVAMLVAGVLTFVFVKYKEYAHTGSLELRENFGHSVLVGQQSGMPENVKCTEFSTQGDRGCARSEEGDFSWMFLAGSVDGQPQCTQAQCLKRCAIALEEIRGKQPRSKAPHQICCYYSPESGCSAKPGAARSHDDGDEGDVALCTVDVGA
eukprot:INCI12288.1.p1 GENE.INCI12288.1~~INCI12288.1.p1  ORF type:complete len:213 (-),score=21.52 INCI12288.1:157-795(-)